MAVLKEIKLKPMKGIYYFYWKGLTLNFKVLEIILIGIIFNVNSETKPNWFEYTCDVKDIDTQPQETILLLRKIYRILIII